MAPETGRETGAAPVEDLLAQNRTRLIAIAQGIVHDAHAAEDIVQETIAATLPRVANIAPDKLAHYLSRAVRRNAIKSKSRRRSARSLDAINSVDVSTSVVAGEIDPFDLEEAIQLLPLPQQTVVRMKYYLGMTFRQIGISLSISTHTAAGRCRHAIAKLKRLLID